jgi:hypothetical protein
MKKVEHTPGPFFFKRGIGIDPRDFIVVDSTGNTVAETNAALYVEDGLEDIHPSVRPITLEEAIANTHLFAAAPDMLAALKELLAYPFQSKPGDRTAKSIWKAFEAIAKAEGGQVDCLECGKPIPYTVGTCPHCGRKEF